jgi:hypothetical protein
MRARGKLGRFSGQLVPLTLSKRTGSANNLFVLCTNNRH